MDEVTGYSKIRYRLCTLILRLRTFNTLSSKEQSQLLDELVSVFDELVVDIDQFKRNTLSFIPHSILESNDNGRSPIFITSPFQLH